MEAPLTSLYQQLILKHYRNPRNKSELMDHTVEAVVNNPVCGDEIRVQMRIVKDQIEDIRFGGQGCSISQASMSMMTALVKGADSDEAISLADRFTEMMHGNEDAASDPTMGDLRALQGVSKFPIRIKCALLGFDALRKALSCRGMESGSGLSPETEALQ
ncbi:MAG: SUF system NifU family Fe-S cluster assembly protein [Gemmatimonadota bacterium]|nr:SUF system NifU family Fe-S cluster assembly protein [Gemmatimonadota bacterium]